MRSTAPFRFRPFARRRARGGREPARARAAVALGTGAATFVAVQLLFVAFTEYSADLSDPIYAARERQLARLDALRPGAPRVAFLGSSRVQDAFAAADVTAAVACNFGTPGAGPITNALYFRRLCAAGRAPDALLLELMYPLCTDLHPWPQEALLLGADRVTRGERERLVAEFGFPGPYYRKQWAKAAVVPFLTHGYKLLGSADHEAVPSGQRLEAAHGTDAHGWLPPNGGLAPNPIKLAKQLAHYRPWVENWRAGPWTDAALRDTLARCRERGVPAALVLMPEGSAFRELLPPDARARLAAYAAGLTREFGCALVDARGWLADDQFVDGHHMLRPAARAFTARLAAEGIEPLLRTRPAP